ncbi:MAG: flavin reductase [Bacteroides sp.]|nr:flavin reductase [Bacteroides sp.]
MKKFIFLLLSVALLAGCNGNAGDKAGDVVAETVALTPEELATRSFDDLFKSVKPSEIHENVFKLFAEDYSVITSGIPEDYNSMVASYGGWGILFEEPVVWGFLRASRYTLEYIRNHRTYTLTFFDAPYKEKIMYFGTASGRGTDKMKTHGLTAVQTPGGSIAYKEASLIIECELAEITTVNPDDYYLQKGRDFVEEGYADAGEYHKLVFGTIKGMWTRK